MLEQGRETPIFMSHVMLDECERVATACDCPEFLNNSLCGFLKFCQQIAVVDSELAFCFRPKPGSSTFYKVHAGERGGYGSLKA